jgi:8-demethyl-8-(2-methoxy-alpha-L-rhamnosyl)tetracenomycin-C 3'-O-methyltransferase
MNLEELAIKHGTDKQSKNGHSYTPFYERYFEPRRNEKLNLFELGVREGWSINLWLEYMPNAEIWCLDNDKEGKCPAKFDSSRVHFTFCSQTDKDALNEIHKRSGKYDIVIDDASHVSPFTIISFETIFPNVKSGGIYVIEDLHISDVPEYNSYGPSILNYLQHLQRDDIKSLNIFNNKICFIEKK